MAEGGPSDSVLDDADSDDESVNTFNCINSTPGRSSYGKSQNPKQSTPQTKKKKTDKNVSKKQKQSTWSWKFKNRLPLPGNGKKLSRPSDQLSPEISPGDMGATSGPRNEPGASGCVCTGYRHNVSSSVVLGATGSGCASEQDRFFAMRDELMQIVPTPVIDFARFNPDDFPTFDIDQVHIEQRRREMEEGVDYGTSSNPQHNQFPLRRFAANEPRMGGMGMSQHEHRRRSSFDELSSILQTECSISPTNNRNRSTFGMGAPALPRSESYNETSRNEYGMAQQIPRTVHTQVDFIHCLVPELNDIAACSFYWGVMDRYEAEKLLDNKPEGSFLLRDSAQEEFLFSVSFRRYGRSLHARIEQWNHQFSFDSHDPGVFCAGTVSGLIKHYKDPSCCMFFEPMLTIPQHRSFAFSLQHLCRATISSNTTYDGIDWLPLPQKLKEYLKYYHYKQKVRVRRFETANSQHVYPAKFEVN
ncbi:unnamed protein product [Owenia fusiformis]|uniref:Suppressor of cytokine signaling 5 n=1 Tax=Owenia fusiformis TaxID=6347 RepID=A0A8S4PHD5_OWEFU|nr:unnamed protein product [Owenia fusiformis]